jgi:Acetyltransferases, including N-acetylases of ribosomal proteins
MEGFFVKHCGTQQLETDRLILRRFVIEDAAAMYRNWASDAEVTKFLTWPAHANLEGTQYVIKEWIDSYIDETFYQWAIVLKENGEEPIGSISVVDRKENVSMAHVGYCIGRKWWHQGVMSEALKAVMDFLFDIVDVNRIEARHDPRNPNSGGVMKKCGMQYEGTLRSSDWNNQGVCDACYYALLKSERNIKRIN